MGNRLRLMKNSSIGERAHYVLLPGDGKSVKENAIHLSRNEHTNRFYWKQADRGNSEQFIWFLRQHRKTYLQKSVPLQGDPSLRSG